MIPNKLEKGDEIRVIAPSRSMSILKEQIIEKAKKKLEEQGFKVTFGKYVNKSINEDYFCATVEERLQDIHEAFADKKVKAILTAIGGYNCNQLLDYIDYELIKKNPKIFCGFSDITALSNSIYAKTGLVTYSGPHFSSFAMEKGLEYTLSYFRKMFMKREEVVIEASKQWSNDAWYKDQMKRTFIPNEGMYIIQEGEAKGTIIGGNLCTLNLLQGTEYMPDLNNCILFLEDDGLVGDAFLKEFDRDLQSLLHYAKGKKINAIILGRAEKVSQMTVKKWENMIETKPELKKIPIICNADFGHTTPIFTFPIGGEASIKIKKGKIELKWKG